jgi:hypothetical protein
MSIYPKERTQGQVRAFMSDLSKFANHTGQLIENAVREEGSLTARAAIKHSPSMSIPLNGVGRDPEGKVLSGFGNGGDGDERSSKFFGDRAVALDIRSIIKKVDDSLIDATGDFSNIDDYVKWRTQGRGRDSLSNLAMNRIRLDDNHLRAYQNFKNLFHGKKSEHKKLDIGGLKSWHQEMKKKFKHRIRRNKGAASGMFETLEGYRVADESTIQAYIKQSQQRVGYLKSGWYACIKQIGPVRIRTNKYPMGQERTFGLKGLATYIKQHTAPGRAMLNFPSVYDNSTPNKTYRVNIVNMVGNADDAGTTAKTMDKTLAYRTANRQGKLKKLLNLSIDQFNKEKNGN